MRRVTPILAALLTLVSIVRGDPAELEARFHQLPAGTNIVDPSTPLVLFGDGGTMEKVAVQGQEFSEAARVRTIKRVAEPYMLELHVKVAEGVKSGDTLLATLYARATELPPGALEVPSQFYFDLTKNPATQSASVPLVINRSWQRYYIPFKVTVDHEPGEGRIRLLAGYDPRVMEIAGLTVTNYGTTLSVSDLPRTPGSYIGQTADAPWRAAAAERIERIRKGDLALLVVNAQGRPVVGTKVRVRMQRHAYGFGSAINAKTLLTEGPDADRYREVIAHDFNKVVIENHLKWYYWERKKDYGPRAVTWLREAGLDVRGHNLLWPSKNNMPESVHPLFNTPVLLHDSILDHITEEASFYRGQLIDWDVVNEPYTNNDVQKVLGDKVLAECFRTARAADPQATLYINDFAILEAGGRDYAHQDHYFKTIEAIHNAGVGLGGIGIQGHFDGNLTPVPRLGEILDRFATFGLPIQITEFDVYTLDEQLQADYTRDFMTMVFSHPSTVGILTWGFWEKVHWLPEAAIYRTDWSLRPAGQVWYDLVFQQWWTPEQQGITDARGKFSLRGFHGDYVVEVQSGNRTIMQTVRLNGPKVGAVLRLP